MSFRFNPYLGHYCAGYVGQAKKNVGSFADFWPEQFSCSPVLSAEQAVYDLASLTKVISTGTLFVQAFIESTLPWADFFNSRVSDLVIELKGTPLEHKTIQEFLEHRSGLRAWKSNFYPTRSTAFYEIARTALWKECLESILEEKVQEPPKIIYSDLGFLILGCYLERKFHIDIETLWTRWKMSHGLSPFSLSFGVQQRSFSRGEVIVPTEIRHAQGEVNDDNAYSLGGIAPHSGLFGSVIEVWDWIQAIYKWSLEDPRVAPWLGFHQKPERFHFAWDTPGNPATTQAGSGAPSTVLGHLGFCGTAFWWDPVSHLGGVLLSNRVYPEHSLESQEIIRLLRREFFSKLWDKSIFSS